MLGPGPYKHSIAARRFHSPCKVSSAGDAQHALEWRGPAGHHLLLFSGFLIFYRAFFCKCLRCCLRSSQFMSRFPFPRRLQRLDPVATPRQRTQACAALRRLLPPPHQPLASIFRLPTTIFLSVCWCQLKQLHISTSCRRCCPRARFPSRHTSTSSLAVCVQKVAI